MIIVSPTKFVKKKSGSFERTLKWMSFFFGRLTIACSRGVGCKRDMQVGMHARSSRIGSGNDQAAFALHCFWSLAALASLDTASVVAGK